MRIATLGAGAMARLLGRRWAACGHDVVFGARNAAQAEASAKATGKRASHGSLRDALDGADIVLHTARGLLISDIVEPEIVSETIIIDINNRPIPDDFDFAPVIESFAEEVQADAPRAHVVKGFNLLSRGILSLERATLEAGAVDLFLAADDEVAASMVGELGRDLGLNPVFIGPLPHARFLEGMGDMLRYLIMQPEHGALTHVALRHLGTPSGQNGRRPGGFS